MSSRRHLKRENPLLRRVRRHANTTTLFRMSGDSLPPAAPPVAQPTLPAVFHPPQPAANSDENIAAAIARAEMPGATVQRQPAAGTTPQQQAQPTPQPVQQAAPPPPQPAVQDDPYDTIPWRRLTRIAELHRQRAQRAVDSGQSSVDSGQRSAVSGQPSAVSGPPSAVNEVPSPPQQQVPLEAAWPVQREPQAKPETPADGDRPATAAEQPVQRAPEDSETQEQLRARLESVKAARPSDSSVELHLPRRPRPTLPGAGQQPEQPAPQQQQTPAVQRQPQPESGTVPTEIGPLPADMWELLGQTPPTTQQTNEQTTQPSNEPGNSPAASIQRAIDAAEQKAVTASQPVGDDAPLPQGPQRQTADGGEPSVVSGQPPAVSGQPPAVSGQPSTVSHQPPAPESAPPVQRQEITQPALELPAATGEPRAEQPLETRPEAVESAPTSEEAIARAIAAAEQPPAPEQLSASEQPPVPEQPTAVEQPRAAEQPGRTAAPEPSQPASVPPSQPVQRTTRPQPASQAPAAPDQKQTAATEPAAPAPQTPTPEQKPQPAPQQPEVRPAEPPSPVQRAPEASPPPETPPARPQVDVARRSATETTGTPPETPVAPASVGGRDRNFRFDNEPAPQSDESDTTDVPSPSDISHAAQDAGSTPELPSSERQPDDSTAPAPAPASEETIARAIAAAEAPSEPDGKADGAPASLPARGDQDGHGPTTEPTPSRPVQQVAQPKRETTAQPQATPTRQAGPGKPAAPSPQQEAPISRRQANPPANAPTTQPTNKPTNHPTIQPSNHPVIARLLAEPEAPVLPPEQNETQPTAPGLSPEPDRAPDNAVERAIAAAEQPAPGATPQQTPQPAPQTPTAAPVQPMTPGQPQLSQAVLARAATPTYASPTASATVMQRQTESYPQAPLGEQSPWTPAVTAPAPAAAPPVQATPATTATPPLQRTVEDEWSFSDVMTPPTVQSRPDREAYFQATESAEAPTRNQRPAATASPTHQTASVAPGLARTVLARAGRDAGAPSNHPTIEPSNQPPTQDSIPSNNPSVATHQVQDPASRRHLQQENSPISNHPISNSPISNLSTLHRAIAAAERPAPKPAAEAPSYERPIQRAETQESDEDGDWNLPQLFSGPEEATPRVEDRNMDRYEKPEESQIDIEELAQRVYNDLRRRLAIDWERERGRR